MEQEPNSTIVYRVSGDVQEDKGLKLAFVINAVNWVIGGFLAAFLRGVWALPDTFTVIPFLGYTLVLQVRMHYLCLRTRLPAQAGENGSAVATYIQQAQANMSM